MRIQLTHDYPADPEQVLQVLADADLARTSTAATGATLVSHDAVTHDDGTVTITSVRRLPAEAIPPAMAGFLGSKIESKIIQVWEAPDSDGERRGTVTMDVTGAPARTVAQLHLSRSEGVTQLHHNWNVSAQIPLLGPAVEEAIGTAIRDALEAEHATGVEHLRGA